MQMCQRLDLYKDSLNAMVGNEFWTPNLVKENSDMWIKWQPSRLFLTQSCTTFLLKCALILGLRTKQQLLPGIKNTYLAKQKKGENGQISKMYIRTVKTFL